MTLLDDINRTFIICFVGGIIFQLLKAFKLPLMKINTSSEVLSTLGGSKYPWSKISFAECRGLSSTINCLLPDAASGQRRLLELHHQWCAGCTKWTTDHGGLHNNGEHPVGPHQGCHNITWHFHNAPLFLEDPSQLTPKEGAPVSSYPNYQQYLWGSQCLPPPPWELFHSSSPDDLTPKEDWLPHSPLTIQGGPLRLHSPVLW